MRNLLVTTLALAGMLVGLTGMASVANAHLASLRCGQKVVTEGATTIKVRAACGEPAAIRVRMVRRLAPRVVTMPCSPAADRLCRQTVYEMRDVPVEQWTYDFGPRAFIKLVTFEQGQLVAVKSAGYGTRH